MFMVFFNLGHVGTAVFFGDLRDQSFFLQKTGKFIRTSPQGDIFSVPGIRYDYKEEAGRDPALEVDDKR